MQSVKSTKQVAAVLGLAPAKLQRAIWEGRIDAPAKGPGDSFCWTDDDIAKASWALLHRAYTPQKENVDVR